jgi:hypothetical protein
MMLPRKPRPFLWLSLAGLLLAALVFFALQRQPPLLVQSLRSLPEVHSVEYQGPREADLVVIHLRDRHYVPRVMCEPDGMDFASNLAAVEKVQQEQMAIARFLIKAHGLKTIFSEGLSKESLPDLNLRLDLLKASKEAGEVS